MESLERMHISRRTVSTVHSVVCTWRKEAESGNQQAQAARRGHLKVELLAHVDDESDKELAVLHVVVLGVVFCESLSLWSQSLNLMGTRQGRNNTW
eukprot:2439585-Rhodomonas_salina.1